MAKGKGEHDWAMTASLLAMYMNAHRKKGSRPVNPEQMIPDIYTGKDSCREERIELSPKESIEVLRKVFVNGTR